MRAGPSSQASPGRTCSCSALPIAGLMLAAIRGLHSCSSSGLPGGRWPQVCASSISHLLSVSRLFPRWHFSPANCPLNKTFSAWETDNVVLVFPLSESFSISNICDLLKDKPKPPSLCVHMTRALKTERDPSLLMRLLPPVTEEFPRMLLHKPLPIEKTPGVFSVVQTGWLVTRD